jgi:hypothetical protein
MAGVRCENEMKKKGNQSVEPVTEGSVALPLQVEPSTEGSVAIPLQVEPSTEG